MKKNIISSFLNKNIWLILSIICILIFFYYLNFFNFKLVERFDLNSLSVSTSSISSPTNSIPEQYKYLAPLPPGNIWSTETQDKWIKYMMSIDPNAKESDLKTSLTNPNPVLGGKTYMEMVSEEEVNILVDTGLYPWDEYVTNFMSTSSNPPLTSEQIDSYRKFYPNRLAYYIWIEKNTVPQLKLLNQIWTGNFGFPIEGQNNSKWYCNYVSTGVQANDHYDVTVVNGDTQTSVTDYSTLPSIIKDFSFEGDPCNVCSMRLIPNEGGKTYQQIYDSPENKCKFKVAGDIPEAYNVYIGKYGNESGASTPSPTTATTTGSPTTASTNA
jgi:hypothetical protein